VSYSSFNTIVALAEVDIGVSVLTIFHPALDVPITLTGNASFGAMGAGINVNVQTAITGAIFTYNFDFVSDTDPGDPADFGIVVWDNNLGTSVAATSIVTSLVSGFDAQGVGLNFPIYAIPDPIMNPYTIVWTGDLPVGDYSVLFIGQNQGATDEVDLFLEYVLPPSGTSVTTYAELVALDYCTKQELIAALAPLPIVETQLTSQILNTSGINVVAIGFKSVSVTALSTDVTIDGQSIPQGFSWSVDSAENERYSNSVTVNGSSYILTEVR